MRTTYKLIFATFVSISLGLPAIGFGDEFVTQEEFLDAFENAMTQTPCSSIETASFVPMNLDNNVFLNVSVDQKEQKVVAKSVTHKSILTINLDFTLSRDGTLIVDKPIVGESALACVGEDREECITYTQKGLNYFSKHSVAEEVTDEKFNSFQCLLTILKGVKEVLN